MKLKCTDQNEPLDLKKEIADISDNNAGRKNSKYIAKRRTIQKVLGQC